MAGFLPLAVPGRKLQAEPCTELLAQVWSAAQLYCTALRFCDRSEHEVCPQRSWTDSDRHADAFPSDFSAVLTVIVPFSNAADIRTCNLRSLSSATRLIGRGPDQLLKTRGPLHGQGGAAHILRSTAYISSAAARPDPSNFWMTGRGPAGPSVFRKMGHGPAHQIYGCWAAAGSGPSRFRKFRGPAWPMNVSKIVGPARPGGVADPWQALVLMFWLNWRSRVALNRGVD